MVYNNKMSSGEGRDYLHSELYTKTKKKKWWQFWKRENEGFIAVGPD